ncbi:PIN domain-containing protein [SCandidatus Aminicenantes bacterium Aminicenantia_JdfR_composite]|jgi:hypothetical protein|nr:PIN domain-containing protein [SCandidatus Aminicenantes bacterium Aminicenantia_JdfR_composite]MCP2606620.1 PIN domain-containing protein [Candidatus Aminicenantes bacterium AC-708-I09]MCP2620771.1 PIN domain-containing protein [Candidatus Aminicenantes bacterium AC-334-E05]
MKILVDTSIWSLALRRKKSPHSTEEESLIKELKELIDEVRVVIIGPIRQEILSGISDSQQFNLLKERLEPFEDLPITTQDYILAAEFYNICRGKGIQGSHIDFLICAVAKNNNLAIFTNDKDFQNYARILKISLHKPREF